MTTEREPRTEAGRALWSWAAEDTPVQPDDWYGSILAIEAEATREALERVRRAVEGHRLMLPPHEDGLYASSALCSCGTFQWDAFVTVDEDTVWIDWWGHVLAAIEGASR